jgi:hypothetical protein
MNFKLKYSTSAKSILSTDEIFARVKRRLDVDKYEILSVTYESIKFRGNPWGLQWNFSPFKS